MGEQIKALVSVTAIHQATTINMRTVAVMRKARVMKMRDNRMRIEIFAEASRHGWSRLAEKKTLNSYVSGDET